MKPISNADHDALVRALPLMRRLAASGKMDIKEYNTMRRAVLALARMERKKS